MFSVITVQGHAGKLIFGLIGPAKLPVVLLVGRAHFYEGHSMELVTFATRVCKVLGVHTMIGALSRCALFGSLSESSSDRLCSYECGWWPQPRL